MAAITPRTFAQAWRVPSVEMRTKQRERTRTMMAWTTHATVTMMAVRYVGCSEVGSLPTVGSGAARGK